MSDFGQILSLFLAANSLDYFISGLFFAMMNLGQFLEDSYLYNLFLTHGPLCTASKCFGDKSIFDTNSEILSL